jgi:hypothetical protein
MRKGCRVSTKTDAKNGTTRDAAKSRRAFLGGIAATAAGALLKPEGVF